MQLTLLEQPKNEMISLQDAKHFIRLDHDYDDAIINTFISATREAMELLLQKSILKQKWKYSIDIKSINNMEYNEKSVLGFNSIKIPLPKPPVINIEQITVYYNNNSMKNIQNFEIEMNEKFFLVINDIGSKSKIKNIEIVYNSGISDNPDNIPYQLKLANMMLVSDAYKNRFKYDSSDFMPKSIEKMLYPFKPMRLL